MSLHRLCVLGHPAGGAVGGFGLEVEGGHRLFPTVSSPAIARRSATLPVLVKLLPSG